MQKKNYTVIIVVLILIIVGTFLLVNFRNSIVHESIKQEQTISDNFHSLGSLKKGTSVGYRELQINYEPKIKQASKHASLYNGLEKARIQIGNGDISDAENTLKTLLVFYPNNDNVLSLLGGLYYMQGNYVQAKNTFSKIIELYPNNSNARENLGMIYEKQKKYDMAINEYLTALNLSKNSALSCIHLAAIYSILNQKNRALFYFKKAYGIIGEKILILTYDTSFNNIRNTPEFIAIIQDALYYKNSGDHENQTND